MWGLDSSGNLGISIARPGHVPAPGENTVGIRIQNAVDPSDLISIQDNILGGWHVHPSDPQWRQEPPENGADISNALIGAINIVIGAGNKQVYFYDSTGIVGQEKLKDLLAR